MAEAREGELKAEMPKQQAEITMAERRAEIAEELKAGMVEEPAEERLVEVEKNASYLRRGLYVGDMEPTIVSDEKELSEGSQSISSICSSR
jgi:hypothetical protein